jgi:HK97 family phage major capsid protein
VKLIDIVRAELRALLDQRTAAQAKLDTIVATAETEGRNLSDDETSAFTTARDELRAIDEKRPAIEVRLAELEADAEAREAAEALAAKIPTTPDVSVRGGGQIGGGVVRAEARTYAKEIDRRAGVADGVLFLRDVAAAHNVGVFVPGAQERIARHMQEERVERADYLGGIEQRDIGTSQFAGLTVPQYLTDLVAPTVRKRRPFADVCRKHPLPAQGMTVNISRITTASAAAIQATQAAAVQETDMDDTLLTIDVRTIAGQQDVSRQALERGTGIDSVVVEDLIGAYHEELDRGIINDDGTSGTHLGIKNVSGNVGVTYTDASPTAAELFPKLADLVQQIQAATNNGLSHFLFHPRRWWWFASQLSSTFPLLTVGNAGVQQVGNVGDTSYDNGMANLLSGKVVLDRNISTALGGGTEDAIYGVDADECHLWEDSNAPLLIRAEQTGAGNLLVKFVVYGYSAFTAGRYPLATGDITGTGLAAPTF